MRGLTFLFAAAAVCIAANNALAGDKIRLAQTGTVTACMMQCNSQAANCQTTCLLPPTGTTTTAGTTNAAVSTSCLMTCSSTQISCQTTCARQSPSQ